MTFEVKIGEKTGKTSAEEFALRRHGSQEHGCLKIGDHLREVVRGVTEFYDPAVNISSLYTLTSAAWCHDLVEDTDTTSDEICDLFGDRVGDLVEILTDKAGRNRLERHLRTYHMIRQDPDATLIKLADRRHNQARSIKHGEHYAAMYEREYIYFKFALWTPHRFKSLWDELDSQYEDLRKMLRW
jgi:(p)ppGpp synthase/HD superfamily hydrolase